ncbi:hypothetical protein BV505_01560 [Thermomonas haemolytica]|nr:hypothetical protein BV505_01560 [Thermomonas haemolytica]
MSCRVGEAGMRRPIGKRSEGAIWGQIAGLPVPVLGVARDETGDGAVRMQRAAGGRGTRRGRIPPVR